MRLFTHIVRQHNSFILINERKYYPGPSGRAGNNTSASGEGFGRTRTQEISYLEDVVSLYFNI